MATIPLMILPNNMFTGCSNLLCAFPLIIHAICNGFGCWYFNFKLLLLLLLKNTTYIQSLYGQHTTHIWSTYASKITIVGTKVWTLITLEIIQGFCHPTTILHCNRTCQRLHIFNYKLNCMCIPLCNFHCEFPPCNFHYAFPLCNSHCAFPPCNLCHTFPLCISTMQFYFAISTMQFPLCNFHYVFPLYNFHCAFPICNFHYAFPLIHGISNFNFFNEHQ